MAGPEGVLRMPRPPKATRTAGRLFPLQPGPPGGLPGRRTHTPLGLFPDADGGCSGRSSEELIRVAVMALMGIPGLIWSVTHRPCWVCNLTGI